jgi:hypothetical protein
MWNANEHAMRIEQVHNKVAVTARFSYAPNNKGAWRTLKHRLNRNRLLGVEQLVRKK